MSNDQALVLFGVLGVTGLALLAAYSIHNAKRSRLAAAEDAYRVALDHLAANPADPGARVRCVETGRAYYALTVPDTYTAVIGSNVFGTQDYQNNTAGREARIAADIEARVGHLKLRTGA